MSHWNAQNCDSLYYVAYKPLLQHVKALYISQGCCHGSRQRRKSHTKSERQKHELRRLRPYWSQVVAICCGKYIYTVWFIGDNDNVSMILLLIYTSTELCDDVAWLANSQSQTYLIWEINNDKSVLGHFSVMSRSLSTQVRRHSWLSEWYQWDQRIHRWSSCVAICFGPHREGALTWEGYIALGWLELKRIKTLTDWRDDVMISFNFLIYSGVSCSWAERAWCLFTPGISIATGPATQVCVGSIFSSRDFPQVLNDAASLVPLLSASAGSRQDIGDLLFGPDPGVPASPIRQQAGYSSR